MSRQSSKRTSATTSKNTPAGKRQRTNSSVDDSGDGDIEEIEPPTLDAAGTKKAKVAFEAKYDTKNTTNEEVLRTCFLLLALNYN